MARPHGSLGIATREFKQLYEQLVIETGLDPVRVLWKILRSRRAELRLQAANALLKYRFTQPRTVELDAPTQMLLGWLSDDDKSEHDGDARPTKH